MHAVARRVLAVAVSVVLLLALLRGGSRYFYCPAMKAVTAASCCAKARAARTPIEEQAIGAPDCCSARHLSTIAPAPVPPAADTVTPPARAAILSVATALPDPGVGPQVRFAHPVRAGPPGPRARQSRLMVSHC